MRRCRRGNTQGLELDNQPLEGYIVHCGSLRALDERTKRRKRQIRLRFEAELDRYLSGEIDEIRLERRGDEDAVKSLTEDKYKRLDWAA